MNCWEPWDLTTPLFYSSWGVPLVEGVFFFCVCVFLFFTFYLLACQVRVIEDESLCLCPLLPLWRLPSVIKSLWLLIRPKVTVCAGRDIAIRKQLTNQLSLMPGIGQNITSRVSLNLCYLHVQRWGCSSVGRASDRHAAEAGSTSRCGKEFFSPLLNSLCRLSYDVHTAPMCNRMQHPLYAR